MDRIDELTLKLLDELATPAEEAELAKLLAESADARVRHFALAEVEAALRADRLPASVAAEAVAQIRSESGADLERTVMRQIGALPTPAWAQQAAPEASPGAHGGSRRGWLAVAALAAAVAVAALVALPWIRRDTRHPPTALILAVSGRAEWIGQSTMPAELAEGQQFPAHRSLRLIGDESTVRLQYPDGTRLDLIGPAQFTLAPSPAGGKLVLLTGGGLKADVQPQPAGRPLLVVTPQAEVRVLGTAFEVLAGEDATRVDLEHGRIELVRNTEPPVLVEPGSIAVIPSGDAPIVVVPRPAMQAAPAAEFEFRDLQTAWFSTPELEQPGEEPLIGLTRWQAVYAHNGRLEAIPFSSFEKKGVEREAQAGPIVAFAEERGYRTVLWNAQTRQEVAALDWRGLPRNDEAPVRVSVLAVSPQGDWLAVRPAASKVLETYELHTLATGAVRSLTGTQKISAMAASPDGRTLAVGRRSIGRSTGNFIELVDVETGEVRQTLAVERSHPLSLAFSADGRRIAVGLTSEVQVWTTDTAEMLASIRLPGVPFTRTALSVDGAVLAASGHQSETVWRWRVPAQVGNEPAELPPLQANGHVRSVAFSPAGRLVVVNDVGQAAVWAPVDLP